MKIKRYTGYLFDLDGTLINTRKLNLQCLKFTMDSFIGLSVNPEELKKQLGRPLRRQIRHFLGHLEQIDYDVVMQTYVDYQLEIRNDYLTLYDGVFDVLQSLKNDGCRLAVVTSRSAPTAHLYLDELKIRPFFASVVTPEDTATAKPHPEPALKALARVGADRDNSLFVGDTCYDILCGRDAGLDTCLIRWPDNEGIYEGPKSTWEIHQLRELL